MRNVKINDVKFDKMEKRGNKKWGWLIAVVLLLATAAACVWYMNDYYHAEEYVNAYLQSSETVTVTTEDDIIFLDGSGTGHALIFYPGAKVEYTAYVPMFYALAEQGIDCFVVKMPGNLAFFGMNQAEDIMEEYEYENWYVSGHSLGGAMAANFAAEHGEKLKGLVLFAAYATKELPDNLCTVSVYGSEDNVLNMEKVESGRVYMPADYTEYCIQGGNHAWFAYYGEQDGDGTATVTREEQQRLTVDAIVNKLIK